MKKIGTKLKLQCLYITVILFLSFKSSCCLKANSNINLNIKTNFHKISQIFKEGLEKKHQNEKEQTSKIPSINNGLGNNDYIIKDKQTDLNELSISDNKKNEDLRSTLVNNFKKTIINENKHLTDSVNTNFIQGKSSILRSLQTESVLSIQNLQANSTNYYNVDNPFDEYEFALNISEGCNIKNCAHPNNCLNETTCACDDFYANYFPSNDKNNLYNENSSNRTNKIYCAYERGSQVALSIFEVFLPGIGFLYTGFYVYGTVKFVICSLLYLVIILKLGRCLKKDRLPSYVESGFYAEYKRDLHFYLMIVAFILIFVWMVIDLSLISFRVWKDPNGVNFQIRQIYSKYD